MLRNPPAADPNAAVMSTRREVEGDSDDDELPYMTQVRGSRVLSKHWWLDE